MEKKIIFKLLFICSSFSYSYGQETGKFNIDSTFHQTEGEAVTFNDMRDYSIKPYIDSLNNYKLNDSLPKFIFDYKFDERRPSLWYSTHFPASLRKLILNKVKNELVLKMILKDEDDRLDKIAGSYGKYKIPFYKYSMRELIMFRLEEIKNRE